MRKTLTLLIAVFLVLCLCACGEAARREDVAGSESSPSSPAAAGDQAADTGADPANTQNPEDGTIPDDGPSPDSASSEDAASGDDASVPDMSAYIGRSIADLIADFGEPSSSEYQDSCEYPDTQDGFLYYEGFTVITMKNSDGETVRTVKIP